MNYYLIQGKYGWSSHYISWFQIVLAPSIEEAKGLALLKEANIKWGEDKEIDINSDDEINKNSNYIKVPNSYDKDFLILIGTADEYFRFYVIDEEALRIESAIELNTSLEKINLKEFLEVYLNKEIINTEKTSNSINK